jgi:hypothetical protein
MVIVFDAQQSHYSMHACCVPALLRQNSSFACKTGHPWERCWVHVLSTSWITHLPFRQPCTLRSHLMHSHLDATILGCAARLHCLAMFLAGCCAVLLLYSAAGLRNQLLLGTPCIRLYKLNSIVRLWMVFITCVPRESQRVELYCAHSISTASALPK